MLLKNYEVNNRKEGERRGGKKKGKGEEREGGKRRKRRGRGEGEKGRKRKRTRQGREKRGTRGRGAGDGATKEERQGTEEGGKERRAREKGKGKKRRKEKERKKEGALCEPDRCKVQCNECSASCQSKLLHITSQAKQKIKSCNTARCRIMVMANSCMRKFKRKAKALKT